MEIKTKTDNILVATARPRYIFFGIYVLAFTGLAIPFIIYGPFLFALFFILLAIGMLACIWGYRLTIDKQAGTITIRSWGVVRPWPKDRTILISDVSHLDTGLAPSAPSTESRIVFYLANNKSIKFGISRGHYYKTFRWFLSIATGHRESGGEYIIGEVAQFIGFNNRDGLGYTWFRPQL